jgi:hypothetical protein
MNCPLLSIKYTAVLSFLLLFACNLLLAQTSIKGRITDEEGNAIELVAVADMATGKGGVSDAKGFFNLKTEAKDSLTIRLRILGFEPLDLPIRLNGTPLMDIGTITMKKSAQMLREVNINSGEINQRNQVSTYSIQSQSVKLLPSAFGDFTKILATLPGVSASNELSNQYAVRGGNFDENLVYVNDMLVYRPQLVRAGQQEGLSFINPDLVEGISFSAGGWQARYGDKLSSVLDIRYKRPTSFKASLTVGLLGGASHVEGKEGRFTYLMGFRHKRSQYLLNTLETEGEYLPQFSDFQALLAYDFSSQKARKEGKETRLEFLSSYARNRYLVLPQSRESTFGTVNQTFRLFIGYLGREEMNYDTYQNGLKLSHRFSKKLKTDWMASYMRATEREYFDVEGGYRLCDVNSNFGTPGFNECISTIGVGSIYNHARNKFDAEIVGLANRTYWDISPKHQIEAGYYVQQEVVNDRFKEYSFLDSSDFVRFIDRVREDNDLQSQRYDTYVQHHVVLTDRLDLNYGLRIGYWSLNRQWLWSPRLQLAYKPEWRKDFLFKFSAGVYRQPPFFREMRDRSGQINKNLKAQSSAHFILASDYNFKLWGRSFKFLAEGYFKYLWDVVPFDQENIRLRYFAANMARAYAVGSDFRVSGDFIKGAESWFSMGILSTKEDIEGDSIGFVRRPTDQRLNLGIFFQDYIPGQPTLRVYLNLVYSTGLPFGPPNATRFRNFFTAPAYRRVDIGFSKLLSFGEGSWLGRQFETVWIGIEVLNLIGAENVISYLWIRDFENRQFAVPNTLSQRFFNLRIIARVGK